MAVKAKKSASRSKKITSRRTTAKSGARKPAKKAIARKPAKRVVKAVKKAAPIATPKAPKILRDKLTKTELLTILSEQAGITRKEAAAVIEALSDVVEASVKKGGLGEFTLPGMFKIVIQRKPATKARKGINPFTGEETMFKAKPARRVVKIRPLKKLKDMAA